MMSGKYQLCRCVAILAFVLTTISVELVIAAPVSSVCPNLRERVSKPPRQRKALRVLVLKFDGKTEAEQNLGSKAAQALRRGLEHHIQDKAGLDAIAAGLSPESIQTEYLDCSVEGHREARTLGRSVDADIVFWGTTSCEQRQPESHRVEVDLKGNNQVSANNLQARGNIHVGITQKPVVNVVVNPTTGEPPTSGIKTYMTVVRWRGLQTEANKGVDFTGPVQNLEFPKLAAENSLALFRFVIGIYAFFNQRYQLAAQRFQEAAHEMYVGSAHRSDLFRLIGTSFLYVGEPEKGINNLGQALTECLPSDSSCRSAALLNLGWANARLGNMKQALSSFEEALELVRQAGDVSGEATALNNIASVSDALGRKTHALRLLENALQLRRQAEDLLGEAITLNNIGSVHLSIRDRTKALSYFERAMKIVQQQDDIAAEAIVLNNIGAVQSAYGYHKQALSLYKKALLHQQYVGDIFGEAATLNNIGVVFSKLEDWKQALENYNQALLLKKKVRDRFGEANAYNNIGTVLNALKNREQALNYFEMALALQHQTGIISGEATTLNNAGVVLYSLGERKKALRYFTRALTIQRQIGDSLGEASTLNNIGNVYAATSNSLAVSHYKQALRLLHELGNSADEAYALVDLGIFSASFGETQQALKHFEKALALQRQIEDIAGQATTLEHMSTIYLALDDKQQALINLENVALLKKQIGDMAGQAIILNNIGSIYGAIGKRQQALDSFNNALLLARMEGEVFGEAIAHNNLGAFYSELENEKQALEHFEQAFSLCTQAGHILCKILTRENKIFSLRLLGQKNLAEEELRQAAKELQSQSSLGAIREKIMLDWISKPNLIVQRSSGQLGVYRFIGVKPSRFSHRTKIILGAVLIAASAPLLAGGGVLISQAKNATSVPTPVCSQECLDSRYKTNIGGGSALIGTGAVLAIGGLVDVVVNLVKLVNNQPSAGAQLQISLQLDSNRGGVVLGGRF